MSEALVTCLLAVAVNAAAMLVIYAVLSGALARRRGAFVVIALVVVAQFFWIAPALWIVEARGSSPAGSYALWFGNWLVSGFGIVLFSKTAERIPAALTEVARMDGLGGFAAWRHTVLPFVGRDLVFIATLTVMATLLPFWGLINLAEASDAITIFERGSSLAEHVGRMVAASLLGAIPLVALFFLEGRALSRPI